MTYSPRYIELHDVPVRQVPDDYSDSAKEDAIEFAESSLELDVYNGKPIPQEKINSMIIAAVKQKATCELVKGTQDPTSAKLGDLSDDGTNKSDYADTFCDRYKEITNKINTTNVLPESGSRTEPYVYSTSNPNDI